MLKIVCIHKFCNYKTSLNLIVVKSEVNSTWNFKFKLNTLKIYLYIHKCTIHMVLETKKKYHKQLFKWTWTSSIHILTVNPTTW